MKTITKGKVEGKRAKERHYGEMMERWTTLRNLAVCALIAIG